MRNILSHFMDAPPEGGPGLSKPGISDLRARFNPSLIGFGIAGDSGSAAAIADQTDRDRYKKILEDRK